MRNYARITHDHSGWTSSEEDLLFTEASRARREGRPLKSAFDNVADATNRRSNSIRNYYYMRLRDDDIKKRYDPQQANTFVPFTDDDENALLRTLLSDQAHGVSVRASTMALANGDMTAMLRYQNKYRSLLKSAPEKVQGVVSQMRAEGLSAYDPYNDEPHHRSGRPRKEHTEDSDIRGIMDETLESLYKVEGLDVAAFFESIGALARSALQGTGLQSMRN